MKRIIMSNNTINLQDFDGEIKQDEEVEVIKDGEKKVMKMKKTELWDATIVRLFKHQPNSYEFGKAGGRHKIYYYSEEDGKRKIESCKKLDLKKAELFGVDKK